MMKIGGYFVSFNSARKVADHLHIDVGEDTPWNNHHIEWPINGWLHDNGQLNIKSAMIRWPREGRDHGVSFMTNFCQGNSEVSGDMVEEEGDVEVRAWLEAAGANRIQWVSMLDSLRITLGGTQPQHMDLKFKHVSLEEILESAARRPSLRAVASF
jgi:hypothetical protein